MEEWRVIKGFSKYAISNEGRIKNLETGHIRIASIHKGYFKVHLRENGFEKTVYIHQAIAQAFLGDCPLGKEVNHKDLNKLNNIPENLEYVTREENRLHWWNNKPYQPHRWTWVNGRSVKFFVGQQKLTDLEVGQIKRMRADGNTLTSVAQKFNISTGHVWKICVGMRRQWL